MKAQADQYHGMYAGFSPTQTATTPYGNAGVAAPSATSPLWNCESGSIIGNQPFVDLGLGPHNPPTPAIPQKHHCEERSDEESETRQHISRTVTASKGHHLC
jgi:hypothetical protein